MEKSEKYGEMCVILGDVVFGLYQNSYEISRENLIKVFASKRRSCSNEREAVCYQEIIGKLSDG